VTVDEDRRGIVVYRVASPEEAKQRAEADPMVKLAVSPWSCTHGRSRAARCPRQLLTTDP
jgi:hypothetical protein